MTFQVPSISAQKENLVFEVKKNGEVLLSCDSNSRSLKQFKRDFANVCYYHSKRDESKTKIMSFKKNEEVLEECLMAEDQDGIVFLKNKYCLPSEY